MRRARRERGVHWRRAATACALVLGLGVGSAQGQLHPKPGREPIISRLDPRFDALVPPAARLDRIVDDHGWVEGPVWVRDILALALAAAVVGVVVPAAHGALADAEQMLHRASTEGVLPHSLAALHARFGTPARAVDMTVTATAADGAVVTYTSTAVDAQEGPLTPVCAPASGTKFPMGDTLVTCTATDTAPEEFRLSDTKTFTVTVLNTAPVVAVPASINVTATGSDGAAVTFAASAVDTQEGSTLLQSGPILSKLQRSDMTPWRLTRP